MANGDPILVACHESDIRIGRFAPFPFCRSRRLPRSTIRHRSVRSNPIDNERAHLLLLPLENCRACHRTLPAASNPHDWPRRQLLRRDRLLQQPSRSKERSTAFVSIARAFRHSYCSCFVILTASLLNSPQKKSGAQKCDHRPSQKNHEIVNIKLRTRAIHVHQPKSAAKMCKRKQLGNVANRLG